MGHDSLQVDFNISRQSEEELRDTLLQLFDRGIAREEKSQTSYRYFSESTGSGGIELGPMTSAQKIFESGGYVRSQSNDLSFITRFIDSGDIEEGPSLHLSWDRVYFRWAHNSDRELEQNADTVAGTVESVYDVLDPLFVWGFMSSPDELWNPTLETTVQRVSDGYVDALGWLTVFPPAAVQRYGRDAVLSAPAWVVRELADGGVMLVTNPTPVDFGAVAQTTHDVAEHLGLGIDDDGLPGVSEHDLS